MKKYLKRIVFFLMRGGALFYKKKPIEKTRIKKFLVFQTGGIGDVLRLFPLIDALRREFPLGKIVTLTEYSPALFRLMNNKHVIDESLQFDFTMNWFKKIMFLYKLRKSDYDMVISPERGSGMLECTMITFLIGRKWRVGFMKDGIGTLLTHSIDFLDDVPIVEQNINLLHALDIHNTSGNPVRVMIDIPDEDIIFARNQLREAKESKRILVALSPTVSNHPELLAWPVERYIELSQILIKNKHTTIILLGDKKDTRISEYFEQKLGEKMYFINFVGKTDLFQAGAIIKSCNVYIGNDSGLLHIANSLGVPSVGIFGPTSPRQVLSSMDNTIIVRGRTHCSPCYLHQPSFTFTCSYDGICLRTITVHDVIQAFDEVTKR